MSSGTAERNPGHRGPETAALSKETLLEKIEEAAALYHRLVLVVADSGSGKTRLLRRISEELGFPLVNVNRELSRRLLDLTERQRTLRLPRLLHEIVDEADADVILLDNLEVLFDVALRQDPLRLLQGLSRNRTLVASWNGAHDGRHMTYATPEHPEYRRYPVQGFVVAGPERAA